MDEKLKQLYAATLKLRRSAERRPLRGKPSSSKALPEACEVGCTIDLRAHDIVVVSHKRAGFGKAIQLGQAQDDGRLLLATGVAFGSKAQGQNAVVVVFAQRGIVAARNSMRFAFEQKLPIIYIETAARSTGASHVRNGKYRHQLPAIPVDQTDVIAIYRVSSEAIDKARRGVGPTLIQCVPPSRDSARGKNRTDCLQSLEWHLRRKKLWSEEFKRQIEDELERET